MKKHRLRSCFLPLAAALLLMTGCSGAASQTESESETAPAAEETVSPDAEQARFDAFTSDLFRRAMESDPLTLHFLLENPAAFGIQIPPAAFPEISADALQQKFEAVREAEKEFRSFHRDLLTPDQRFTADLLADSFECSANGESTALFYQPLRPVSGIQARLPLILSEYEFREKEDIERYLQFLTDLDRYYEEIVSYEKERIEAGLFLSDPAIDRMVQSCKDYMVRPENSLLTESFRLRLEAFPDLTEKEKEEYESRHLAVMKEHFIPAYTGLSESLTAMKGQAPDDLGMCRHENGKAAYAAMVHTLTGSSSSPQELQVRIERQLQSALSEVSILLQNNPGLQQQMNLSSFTMTEPEEIISLLESELQDDYPPVPVSGCPVSVLPDSAGSSVPAVSFLPAPIDSDETGTIRLSSEAAGRPDLFSLLAEKSWPGQFYRQAFLKAKHSCPLHFLLSCEGGRAGWELYSGFTSIGFDSGLPDKVKELKRCSEASIRALYALLDIRIHYDGWNQASTASYLEETFGITDPEVAENIYLTAADSPCRFVTPYTGYLEIASMKADAAETLGSRFSLQNFHRFILETEGAPFRMVRPRFQTWLLTYDMMQPAAD